MLSFFNQLLNDLLFAFTNVLLVIVFSLILQFLIPSFKHWLDNIKYVLTLIFLLQPAIAQIQSISQIIHVMGSSFLGLYPILSALFLTTGGAFNLLNFQPAMLVFSYGAIYLSKELLLPILFMALFFDIISRLLPEMSFIKVSNMLRSTLLGVVSAIAAAYSIFITVGGTLNWALSGITSEPIQELIQQNVPFIGSFLTESIRSMGQHTSTVSVLVGGWLIGTIWTIALLPTLKTLIIALAYRWFAALVEPITEKNISHIIDDIGKTLFILCAITFMIAFAFIYTAIFLITIVKLMIVVK